MDVVELSEHELPQDPAPPVARQNPDPAHARGLSGAPGSRQLERIRRRHADRPTVVPGCEHPVERHHLAVTLDVVVLQFLAERRVRREQDRGELVLGRAPVLEAHRWSKLRDPLEWRVLDHQPPLAAVLGEADGDDAAGLERGHDAFPERGVAHGVARREHQPGVAARRGAALAGEP